LSLVNRNSSLSQIAGDLEAEKPLELAEVVALVILVELVVDGLAKGDGSGGNRSR
jgi:hypothetical protein